ncbi:MAG: hypothetical protein AAF768_12935 [Pseudomonadota bacterium]
MFDRDDLRAAVSANVLSADQAARLEAFFVSRKGGGDPEVQMGQENLRFLSNFNDIFITMGLIILFIGITALVGAVSSPMMASGNILSGLLVVIPVAGFAWLLMEYFCARRRLLLPSMALSIIFVIFCTAGAMLVSAAILGADVENLDFTEMWGTTGRLGVMVFLSALAASLAVFFRFRLPFSLALSALAAAGAVYVAAGFFGSIQNVVGGPLLLIMGAITLGVAILFDMRDPERIRKASDNAFWLHLAAAPQLIWGISALVTGSNIIGGSTSGTDNAAQGITLLLVLLAIGIGSLALNRRALIAASLLTFIVTLSFVLSRVGFDGFNIFMIVTIIIGSGVVLLGAGWKTARRLVLNFFPRGGVWSRLFPPEPL